jgi:CMP-N-acetylneuraminic acid synthetase
LGDETLVRRCLRTALECPELSDVALSSEDPEILEEAQGLHGITIVERPNRLAGDRSGVSDAVMHALQTVECGHTSPFEAVAVLQCTSPFTQASDVTGTIRLLERAGTESAVTVTRLDHAVHPFKLKRLVRDRLVPVFEDDEGRSVDGLPDVWVRNGSVYVSRRGVIERNQMISSDCVGFTMPRERSIDINDAVDLAIARVLWGEQEQRLRTD